MSKVSQIRTLFKTNDPKLERIISVYEDILSVYEVLKPFYIPKTQEIIFDSDTNKNPYNFNLNNSTLVYQVSN